MTAPPPVSHVPLAAPIEARFVARPESYLREVKTAGWAVRDAREMVVAAFTGPDAQAHAERHAAALQGAYELRVRRERALGTLLRALDTFSTAELLTLTAALDAGGQVTVRRAVRAVGASE